MVCTLLLLLMFAPWLTMSTAMEPTHLLQTGMITNVYVTEPGDLFITTSTGSLYNMSSTELTAQDVYQFLTSICKGGLVADKDHIFLCLCNGSCFAIKNGTISLLSQDITIGDSTQYVMLTFNSSLYTANYGTRQWIPLKGTYLHNVGYASNTINRQEFYYTYTVLGIFSRRFVAGFESNGFIYFLVQDKKNNHNDIRVLRVCEDMNVSETSFRALYEAHLKAIPDSATSLLVNGQLVTIGTVTMVMMSMSFEGTSVVYGVKLADINGVMDKSFNDCITANDKKIPVPWRDPKNQEKCSQFGHLTQVRQCDFNPISSSVYALHAKLEDRIQTLLEVAGHITASLFFEYLSQQHLYIAVTNSTVSTVNKYWVFVRDSEAIISAELSNVKYLPEAVYHLIWSPQHEKVFAASNTSIYSLPVDDCSFQTSCSSCTSYQNQFCGWCVVEGHCSQQRKCINGDLNGRWIQQASDCPHVDISSTIVSTDTSNKIILTSNNTLPTLSINETYYCLLTNIHDNITIVTPFVNSTCQMEYLLPSFNGQHLNLDISLTSSLSLPFPIVVSTTNLTIINCSKIDSCSQCLTKWPNVCGWCTYDMICTGASSYCINNSSWSNSPQDKPVNQVCPSLSASASYKLPVSSINEVVLTGFNLPSPKVISGTQYTCYLRQLNSSPLQTVAIYHNLTHLTCQFGSLNYFSELTTAFDLYVTWSTPSTGHHYTLEVSNTTSSTNNVLAILFYNCTRLSQSCSFCLYQSSLLTLNCVWCETGCSSNSECHNPIAMEKDNCPVPNISSIFPNSGPAAGGTSVIIYGNDLPFNFYDIFNIYIGSIECLLHNTSFIPGRQVSCITGASSSIGYKNILINFNKKGLNLSINSTSVHYLYQIPTLNSIVPAWGPVAGGTLVVVSGSFLDIGDSSTTRVRVAGVFCSKLNVTHLSISCVTFPTLFGSGVGQVELIIDNFYVTSSNITFEYRTNPSCISLVPNKIIPAGGVTLQFTGRHLTSAPRPILIIEYSNEIYTTVCHPISDTVLTCQAPPISSSQSFDSPLMLNYRLVLDNIICRPSSSQLTLQLKPNPVFESIISDGTSLSGITILGNHLDSVLVKEISVTVDNAVCVIQRVTAKSLYCLLPQITTTQRKYGANVTVSIANGTLVYDVGQIHYNLNGNGVTKTGTLSSLMLAIIIVVVTLVTAILMLVVAAVIVKYWKMKHPPLRNLTKRTILRNRTTTPTAKGLEISLQPSNHYCDVIERSGDIIYETIPDNIYQSPSLENQYQNCNQKTYENVKETIQTTTHLTLPLSNPIYSNATLPNNRPVSELISSNQYDHTNNTISRHSASSPDLSQSSWPSSTQDLLQGNTSEETDGDQAGIPEYTKIIKKLTPIDENRIYGKPIEKRPQLLQLPQEEYVAMHSASTTNTGSTRPSPQFDFPVVTNYIEMRSATTTPLTERPESSYVVMRSASLSSSEVKSPTNPPPLPGCYGNKSPTVPSRSLLMEESQEESHVNDVFLKNND